MTDKEGKLVWFGDYYGWGKLKNSTKVTDSAYQPFRLQIQYTNHETGLHYNFFRYYEPNAGAVCESGSGWVVGGDNLCWFAPNTLTWMDVLGWYSVGSKGTMRYQMNMTESNKFRTFTGHSSEAGGKGATNPLIKKYFENIKKMLEVEGVWKLIF